MIDRDPLRGAVFRRRAAGHTSILIRVLLNLETIVGAYIRASHHLRVDDRIHPRAAARVRRAETRSPGSVGGAMDVLPYSARLLTIVPRFYAAYGNGPVIAVVVFRGARPVRGIRKAASWSLCTPRVAAAVRVVVFSPSRRRGSGRIIGALLALAAGRGRF